MNWTFKVHATTKYVRVFIAEASVKCCVEPRQEEEEEDRELNDMYKWRVIGDGVEMIKSSNENINDNRIE